MSAARNGNILADTINSRAAPRNTQAPVKALLARFSIADHSIPIGRERDNGNQFRSKLQLDNQKHKLQNSSRHLTPVHNSPETRPPQRLIPRYVGCSADTVQAVRNQGQRGYPRCSDLTTTPIETPKKTCRIQRAEYANKEVKNDRTVNSRSTPMSPVPHMSKLGAE